MKNTLLLILISFFFNVIYSQNDDKPIKNSLYIPISIYNEYYKKNDTKKDSLIFKIQDNDTLVFIEDFKKPKGIDVPYEYKDSTFLSYYKKIAYKTKGIDSVDAKHSMYYWKTPIKIYFSKSVSKNTKNSLMRFTKKISKNIDSLNIFEVKNINESNFTIYYSGDFEYESGLKNRNNNSYYIHWNKKNQIYKGSIKLNPNLLFNEALIQNKLRLLLIQTLGHFNLTNYLKCNNYFAACFSQNKKMSTFDFEILKYHYSYGICKGTSLETFEENHKMAKKALKTNNKNLTFFHPF